VVEGVRNAYAIAESFLSGREIADSDNADTALADEAAINFGVDAGRFAVATVRYSANATRWAADTRIHVSLARTTADATVLAAQAAATYGSTATDAAITIKDAALRDYQVLRELDGTDKDFGDPIDLVSLGPTWPNGDPEWLTAEQLKKQAGRAFPDPDSLQWLLNTEDS
jgi:hypothetical protein